MNGYRLLQHRRPLYALRVQHGELGHVNSQTLAGNTRSAGYHLMEHSILTLIAVFRYRRIMH